MGGVGAVVEYSNTKIVAESSDPDGIIRKPQTVRMFYYSNVRF